MPRWVTSLRPTYTRRRQAASPSQTGRIPTAATNHLTLVVTTQHHAQVSEQGGVQAGHAVDGRIHRHRESPGIPAVEGRRHVNPTFPLRVRGSALIPPAARSRSQTSSTVRTPITACRSRALRHSVHTAFQVFFSNQGAQGLLGQASRQQLDSVFGTHKDTDAVEQLLNKGEMQAGEGFHGTEVLSKDVGRGSFTIDTRGKTLTGVP
ncbi:hypothetical protein AcW2_006066 [Taiwanofungus camphoratus]|nr:hypothetical protein AcW2_006066 [Antrodia cinnamomea]